MNNDVIIPAQIRAGRALLGWSQEELAKEAELGLSTIRDTESERRAADTAAVASIRRALWNGGVVFIAGRPDEGPGVRLVANRPNVIRRPTTMQKYEGMPFAVEWQGKVVTVFVAISVIDDLGGHRGNTTDEAYIQTFERHRGQLLDAIAIAVKDPGNFDQFGRLYLRQKDIDTLKDGKWHQVMLDKAEDIRDAEARALMNKFASLLYKTGISSNVQVFADRGNNGGHIFYFSPQASVLGENLLAEFNATACSTPPDFTTLKKVKL